MATGYLQVMVTTQGSLPLENVKITITDGRTMKVLDDKTSYTDSSGQSALTRLDTVDVEYSLDENNTTVLPYKNYNLMIEKEGFIQGEIIGVQIFRGQTSLQAIDLLPRPTDFGSNFEMEYSRGGVAKLFDVQPNLQQGTSEAVLSQVIIPEYVTVHLGKPQESAENVRVTFLTYLKSVAASEIYPTWPYEALKANILCQVTFILNRIYTEWYRSRGYNFDITSSTSYDQKYIHNRSTFASTDQVVEEVFNNFVTKAGKKGPYFTEYCDGKQVTCNGLKQWGAFDKAKEGLTALEILQYYYGDVIINETNNISSVTTSYPGTPLRLGNQSRYVQIIQAQLNRIADDYPAIPKVSVDGKFGPATQRQVKKFQEIFKLTADGVVGKSTWYKISYIYVSVKKLAQLTSEGESIEDGSYPGYVVKQGERGINVKIVQFYLNQAAVYVSGITPVAIDGIFGPATRQQVINFQKFFNLTPDGKVGRLTWDKMYNIFLSIQAGVQVPVPTPPRRDAYPGTLFKLGSTGGNVVKIQTWLNGLAGTYRQIPRVRVDGIYGPATQNSVIAFQSLFGLSADGVVGKNTWNALYNAWQNLAAEGQL